VFDHNRSALIGDKNKELSVHLQVAFNLLHEAAIEGRKQV
jgi:hypothetical protein